MTPRTAARQSPLSRGFSSQEYWSGLPFSSPGDLPQPGIEPVSPALQADSLPSEPPGKPPRGTRRVQTQGRGSEICRTGLPDTRPYTTPCSADTAPRRRDYTLTSRESRLQQQNKAVADFVFLHAEIKELSFLSNITANIYMKPWYVSELCEVHNLDYGLI